MTMKGLSRREFLAVGGFGVLASTVGLTGCPAATGLAVIVRVASRLLRVGGVLFRASDAVLNIKGIMERGSQIFNPQLSYSEGSDLRNGAGLIVEDGAGKRFNPRFGIVDDIGIVQVCDPTGVMVLRNQTNSTAPIIRDLSIDEHLGVFDLAQRRGWYNVKTLDGETGWVHGNCLQRLPRK